MKAIFYSISLMSIGLVISSTILKTEITVQDFELIDKKFILTGFKDSLSNTIELVDKNKLEVKILFEKRKKERVSFRTVSSDGYHWGTFTGVNYPDKTFVNFHGGVDMMLNAASIEKDDYKKEIVLKLYEIVHTIYRYEYSENKLTLYAKEEGATIEIIYREDE